MLHVVWLNMLTIYNIDCMISCIFCIANVICSSWWMALGPCPNPMGSQTLWANTVMPSLGYTLKRPLCSRNSYLNLPARTTTCEPSGARCLLEMSRPHPSDMYAVRIMSFAWDRKSDSQLNSMYVWITWLIWWLIPIVPTKSLQPFQWFDNNK